MAQGGWFLELALDVVVMTGYTACVTVCLCDQRAPGAGAA